MALTAQALRLAPTRWHRHPGVREPSQLTLGERAADRLRNGMGSWSFVFGALAFLGAWMALNGGSGFDPYPFILLNLLLSCLAAMQGAILLIAARRSDQISSELALHDYQTDTRAADALDAMRQEVAELRLGQDRLMHAVTAMTPRTAPPLSRSATQEVVDPSARAAARRPRHTQSSTATASTPSRTSLPRPNRLSSTR